MLGYELFKEILVDQIKKYLPEEYQGYPLQVRKVEIANMVVDGIAFEIPDRPFTSVHLNDAYEAYRECESMEDVLTEVAVQMVERYEKASKIGGLKENATKENVLMKLINTGMNQELLAHCPHREIMDLSVVYYWAFQMDEEGMTTAMINNENVEIIHATEQELFDLATQNAKRLIPTTINELGEMLNASLGGLGFGENVAPIEFDTKMFVVSNEHGFIGAAAMLDDEALHKVAEYFGDNLYILPSSIHEVLAVKAQEGQEEELAQMVKSINEAEVSLENRLSDNVYFYDRLKRELSMATGSPELNLLNGSKRENEVKTPMLHSGR